ncbi:hypothetical protein KX928_02655 [Roseobacter sp. YSTF-M11]|uniref:Mitochondrial inner membrane protein n=1 Tax=Roseobacter insulae TaxID=2859783 RepID=A0A9X1JYY8_9RHOB|nr:mitofilin family membrane protein [Roseobacter insulae]MBW4706679.1 hypothetical protein [Roseobacter insulae]
MAKSKNQKDLSADDSAKDAARNETDEKLKEAASEIPAEEPHTTPDEKADEPPGDPVTEDSRTETEEVPHELLEAEPEADIMSDDAEARAAAEALQEEPLHHDDASTNTDAEQQPASPPPAQHQGSIWPAVFGGVIAALLGFIAGRGDMLEAYLPASMQRQTVDLAPVEAQTAALAETDEALAARLEAVEEAAAAIPTTQSVAPDEALMASVDALQSSVVQLTTRLETLEAQPAPAPSEPVADNSEEIAALQSVLAELQARLSDDDARERTEAERALAQAALTRVVTAVDAGEAFEPALGALEEVAPVEVPDALRAAAAEGVPTMAALRDGFPDAARAGLSAARADVPETDVQGIGGFLRRQLNARSVSPREGSDPDAVLSRAEAALKSGDLDAALGEMDALPEAAKSAMQDWLEGARARQAARAATKSLSDSLTVN